MTSTTARGNGPLRQRVASLVNAGTARTLDELRPHLRDRASGAAVGHLVGTMIRDGLLVQKRAGVLGVTAKGARLVSITPPVFAGGTYTPPKAPPRRPGSMDFARLPSVAAGAARPYWCAASVESA